MFFGTALAADQTLKVGAYHNPPKIYVEDEKVSGFHATLIETIADRQGWTIEYVIGTWDEGLSRLESGEIDVMVDVAYTSSRTELYDFSKEPVLNNWGIIYTGSGFEPQTIVALEGKTVAVMKKSTHTDYFRELVNQFDINVDVIEVDSYTSVFALVKEGAADAGVVNRLFGFTNREEYELKETPIIFNPREIRYALPKGAKLNAELIAGIDESLVELKSEESGAYHKALEELFGTSIEVRSLLPILYGAIGILAFIVLVMGIYYFAAFREISLRKKAESAQHASEARFRETFEKSPVGIMILNKSHKVVDVNPKTLELSGYKREDFVNKGIPELAKLFKMNVKEIASAFKGFLTRKTGSSEWVMVNKNGQKLDIRIIPSLIKEDGKLIILLEDISERKKAKEELAKKMSELERFNKMAVGREMKLIELKKKINKLEGKK